MAEHQSFKNSKNKLKTIWNRNQATDASLNNNSNEVTKFFHEQQKLKNPSIIYDSDWIVSQPGSVFDRSTTIGDIGGGVLAILLQPEVQVPDNILPFLNWQLLIKTAPNVKVEDFYEHTTHPLRSDWVEVRGDSTVIFSGQTTANALLPSTIFTDDDIDEGTINGSFTKKVFSVEIQYNEGAELRRLTGNVIELEALSSVDSDEYTCSPNNIITLDYGVHKFLNITSSSVQAVWSKLDNSESMIFHGITETVNFSILVHEIWTVELGRLEKWNGSGWEVISTGVITVDFDSSDVQSRDFEFLGYWLYFYSDIGHRVNLFLQSASSGFGSGNCRGNLQTPIITNRPNPTQVPYSSLYTEINKTGKPESNAVTTPPSRFHGGYPTEHVYQKLGDNHYKLYFRKTFHVTASCTRLQLNPTDRYVVSYNASGSTYINNTIVCNNTNELEYVPELGDLQYRLIGSLVNPLYWSEQRKYSNDV